MGAVKGMLMDVQEYVHEFYGPDGELIVPRQTIVAQSKKKFGVTFGEYAEEVLNRDTGPDYLYEEYAHQQLLQEQEDVPF